MSLITSCPACGTMFRVVPDQLKISEGWVRCGHCSEIFDATAHLSDESILAEPATAQAAARPPDPPARVAAPPPVPEATPRGVAPPAMPERPTASGELAGQPVTPPLRRPERPRAAPAPAPAPEPSVFFGDSQALEPSPLDSPFVFRRSDLVLPDDSSVLPAEPLEDRRPHDEDEHDEAAAAVVANVSFVRQGRRRAFWRRPLVRIALAFGSLLLAALLVLQLAWQDRDRLALAEPALRPALERMCDVLQCTLGPPRRIEAIVIESSGFNRLRNDTYRLAFTLRNSAAVQVAVPALELTVTDAQDQAVARRVLTPAELGAPGEAIPAGSEWARSLGVVLTMPGSARVAGYRLLAFYP
ncbi:DUF3426 domain-containing protein [Ramlibacter sp.]|uniref:DUF3426 domain-containing protein n=1 Tax=Ramlibacter sp. TaxID=1917967 RepID=UPI00262A1AF6|nr:DUF3426 domain-containing protein [Ramlibacter sp.]MDB5957858.1 hypothetical protein [Ramlibacter sp.]